MRDQAREEARERKRAEGALRKARDELEIRVQERAAELVKANNEALNVIKLSAKQARCNALSGGKVWMTKLVS